MSRTLIVAGSCAVDGCPNDPTHLARDGKVSGDRAWCPTHYARWRKTGSPFGLRKAGSPGLPGDCHPMWKGDDAGYDAIHLRLRARRGPATQSSCIDCGGPADQWSYTKDCPNEKREERQGRVHAYSTDLNRYVARCFSCHTLFDHTQAEVTP